MRPMHLMALLHARDKPAAAKDAAKVGTKPAAALGADAEPLEEAARGEELTAMTGFRFEVHRPSISSTQGFVQQAQNRSNAQDGTPNRALVLAPVVQTPFREPPVVPELVKGLQGGSCNYMEGVDRVAAYCTRGLKPDAGALSRLREGEIDAVCFTSIMEAEGLFQHWRPDNAARTQRRPVLCCFGPSTARGVANALAGEAEELLWVNKDFASFDGFARQMAAFLGPAPES